MHAVCTYLQLMCVLSMLAAASTDPGIVPRGMRSSVLPDGFIPAPRSVDIRGTPCELRCVSGSARVVI